MEKTIQQAEQAIRNGDTRTGFEILRQVLSENPNSERAWWIMSGLVPREQRAHCLNEVLRINPDNHMARETLQKLGPLPPAEAGQPEQAEDSSPADGRAPLPPRPAAIPGGPRTWFYTHGSRLYLTLLADEGIIHALADSGQDHKIQVALEQGRLPDALLKTKTAIAYKNIQRVRQMMSSLRVFFTSHGKQASLRLELADKEDADQVLNLLETKLGMDFTLASAPMKTGTALGISAIFTLGAAGLTAFFYWGAMEVASGRAAASGSIRTRSIINLLEMLGPGGVLAVGGILILIALGVSAWLLLKPPTVTELTRIP